MDNIHRSPNWLNFLRQNARVLSHFDAVRSTINGIRFASEPKNPDNFVLVRSLLSALKY